MGQSVDFWVSEWLCQQIFISQLANADHARIIKIAETFQVVCTLLNVRWAISLDRVDQTHADSVEHGLIFCHSIDDACRVFRSLKRHSRAR